MRRLSFIRIEQRNPHLASSVKLEKVRGETWNSTPLW